MYYMYFKNLYLIFSEHSEDVNFCIRGEAETLSARGDDSGHEGAVAQLIVQSLLVRPVGALTDLAEVGMIFGQP